MKQSKLDKAIQLWEDYYYEVDRYDNYRCSGLPMRDGGSKMPVNFQEYLRSNQHARKTYKELFEMCGIRDEVIREAKRICSRKG